MALHTDLTPLTIQGKILQFRLSKRSLCRALEQFPQRSLDDISNQVHRIDKVIAGIKITIVFDDRDISAYRAENAQ